MGPPLSTWPYSHQTIDSVRVSDVASDKNTQKKCILVNFIDNFRVLCLNFTFALLIFQIVLSLNYVKAGPVILNMDYLQGPVPLARNIRHLPCISRRTGQEGLCMFAIDCLKANGSHLGTCIDRFYFGSCCQIPDKTILPQIIGNNIEDNTIDSGNFVHPQTEDKVQSTVTKIPDIFPTRKPTTEKIKVTEAVTENLEPQDKTDYLEDKLEATTHNEVKLTTAVTVETTTKVQTTNSTTVVTEIPMKLSTFQTVSGDSNTVTEESKIQSTEAPKTTVTTTTIKPTRKPIKPTHKPFRPTNFTRPQYVTSTQKPRPTKPVLVFNITRKPPYRPPPKRPTTKKPLPSPPRLNITILPQSTSSRPIFTRPLVTSITYINTTSNTEDITISSTSTTTTTPSTTTVTTTTTTTAPITTTTTTQTPVTTEEIAETIETITEILPSPTTTESTTLSTTSQSTTSTTTTTEPPPKTSQSTTSSTTTTTVIEKETLNPVSETEAPSSSAPPVSSTAYPPLVTWSTIDGVTKTPENTSTAADENWSPITPPEGWVLISTIPPVPETTTTMATTTTTTSTTPKPTTTTSTTTSTTTTTELPTTMIETSIQDTTIPVTQAIEKTTESLPEPTIVESLTTIITTTTEKPTTETVETTQALLEFTVNVTLSPTMPTTTVGSTTIGNISLTTSNVTDVTLQTTTEKHTTLPDPMLTEIFSNSTTSNLEKDDYKKVCGRRFWPVGRIVGGTKSSFGQWPWQISLRQYRTSTYLHKCGAALLNENWAITAAHCVEHVPPSELLVRLGEHDLAVDDEPYGYAERRVQIVASHPHFDPATFEYDLALLRFYEPVKFQPNIIPICVPDDDDYYVGKTAYVTGWGRLYDEGPLPSVLQEVQVPVINNSACEAMYQAAGYNEHIPNIFICAGRQKGGADSCEGDSGGPMVIQRARDNRFVLSGVISWGIGCAEPNQPGVYTRISEFRDWINQILLF